VFDVEQLFERLRPKLHRYCARMSGSVIDGEDVVQETLVTARADNGRARASPRVCGTL